MKIDFNQPILNIDNTPTIGENKKPFTVREACVSSLLTRYQDELNLDGGEQFKRFKLAERVWINEGDFNAEEIALIKRLVARNYPPLVVGRVYETIDP